MFQGPTNFFFQSQSTILVRPGHHLGAPGHHLGAPGHHHGAPGHHHGAPGHHHGAPGHHPGAPGHHHGAPGHHLGAPMAPSCCTNCGGFTTSPSPLKSLPDICHSVSSRGFNV